MQDLGPRLAVTQSRLLSRYWLKYFRAMVLSLVTALFFAIGVQNRTCLQIALAAEGRATLTAADQALRMQALLREIVTGAYDIRHVSPPSEFPSPDPFGPSPIDDDEAKWQCQENNSKRRISPPIVYFVPNSNVIDNTYIGRGRMGRPAPCIWKTSHVNTFAPSCTN